MNPEFLKEGEAVDDFMNPDRIVIGAIDEKSQCVLAEVYKSFNGVDVVRTNTRTAEMIKYTANSLLATMISFSNEIANLCLIGSGIDVVEVMNGVHLDKRLSPMTDSGGRIVPSFTSYIEAGCGFGGSCFPKDLKALISYGRHEGATMKLLEAVVDINEGQPHKVIDLLSEEFGTLEGLKVAVLGLAFKPGTDDVRESPSIKAIKELISQGTIIKAYDPIATQSAKEAIDHNGVEFCKDLSSAIDGVDAILVMTRWEEFTRLPDMLSDLESQPVVVDARRMLDKRSFARYKGIGLGA
jgi:UDPglucose 6-dehydrogenase/GDP-mannose 6-dehydrogenase